MRLCIRITIKLNNMKKKEIITLNTCPPIPLRNYDWEAYRDEWDLRDPIGYGATEEEAIADLLEQEMERE
jgi:hypothetical protein